ncbi:nicotinamide N-methyltransferase-like [Lissotriton helveticus]
MAATMDLKEFLEKCSDTQKIREAYFIPTSSYFEDIATGVFSHFIKILSSGDIKGDTVNGLSFGPYIFYTLPVCEYFKKINFACPIDRSIQEVHKWLKNESDALDWSGIGKMVGELQGCGESWIEKQQILQRKVNQVFICDVMSSNPLSPIIQPPADCLILAHCLENLVRDKKSFCKALKNVSTLLKTKGNLIMIAALEATFFMVGDVKFPLLCMDEDFLRDALIRAGYAIKEFHIIHRKQKSLYYLADYKCFVILKACKEREV